MEKYTCGPLLYKVINPTPSRAQSLVASLPHDSAARQVGRDRRSSSLTRYIPSRAVILASAEHHVTPAPLPPLSTPYLASFS